LVGEDVPGSNINPMSCVGGGSCFYVATNGAIASVTGAVVQQTVFPDLLPQPYAIDCSTNQTCVLGSNNGVVYIGS
jgi:hypothetical protein